MTTHPQKSATIKEIPGMPGFYQVECLDSESTTGGTYTNLDQAINVLKGHLITLTDGHSDESILNDMFIATENVIKVMKILRLKGHFNEKEVSKKD